ncbi:MAG: cysteine--tRNA ligase [Candidatus Planktophila sp.]
MSFEDELAASIGKRVSIRLHEGGSFRDILGVLQNETTVIKGDATTAEFDPKAIAYFRVVPVFNRRNQAMKALHLYETASRSLCEISGDEIRIYACGPTVYRDAHIGNMRTFLLTDLIRRALALNGIATITVSNINDVGHMSENLDGSDSGDKVLEEAVREKVEPLAIARRYEEKFKADLEQLNILPADFYPRASENIPEIIQSIQELIEKDFAYIGTDGNIYFDAQKAYSYGYISGNKLESLKPGHRYEYLGDGGKRFHADWALWKLAGKRSEMIWESPWGSGFPGWHIECSAMSLQLLGTSVDIHVGGIDLRFPHHEDERAQTNAIAGGEVVKNWIHGEHLLFEGKKMAKSSGNVILVSDITERGYDPLALRLALLENKYRSQIDMTWAAIAAADSTLKRWRKAISAWGSSDEIKIDDEIYSHFMSDLDTSKAILRLRALEKDSTVGVLDKRAIFLFADQVLGLDLAREAEPEIAAEITFEALQLIEQRAAAREAKNWSESDRLRDLLALMDIAVVDGAEGQSWSIRI